MNAELTSVQNQPTSLTPDPTQQDQYLPKKHFLENIPDNRMSIYIILFIIVVPPLGLILMWLWAKWPRKIKIIITSVLILLPTLAMLWTWLLVSSLS